jgi:hypothetical protein
MKAGFRNGRLVTVAPRGKSADGHINWLCQCDCGETKTVASNMLRDSGTKSCGCLRKEAASKRLAKNGVWNEGKSYAINGGEHCYKTRHSWAKAAIRKYGNKCMECGWDKARCDVHHRIRKAIGGLHTLTNALVLCPNCHRVHHESESLCAS